MSTPDPVPAPATQPPPAAVAWYKSATIQGILTIIVTRVVDRVQQKYHVDLSVFGLSVNDIVSWLMDAISAGAVAFVAHARLAKSFPPIVSTQAKADAANAAAAPPK